jgi:N-acetylmuramic acid 6-phosphate etherase
MTIEPTALDRLVTEQVDERYGSIDTASVAELAALMNDADATVPGAVRGALGQVVPAIEAIVDRLAGGGRLLYVGAGTAGRMGFLDAAECPPTFSTPPEEVQAIIAGGPDALRVAVEGAEDDPGAGADAIVAHNVGPRDAVFGITASGRTPFVLGAVRAAHHRGALTAGLSCNPNAPLSALVDHAIEVPVGPEVVAGSTRLKAGTAQKLVLNMVSTIAMVRLGKTYGNLMVDVRITNAKLRDRAVRIVQQVTGVARPDAEIALEAAGLDVKVAILLLDGASTVEEARHHLEHGGDGRLRAARESAKESP